MVPITLAFREDLSWLLPLGRVQSAPAEGEVSLVHARPEAQMVYKTLQQNGALFVHDLAQVTGLVPTRLRRL